MARKAFMVFVLVPAAGLTFVLAKVSKTICGAELGIHASNKLHHAIPEKTLECYRQHDQSILLESSR